MLQDKTWKGSFIPWIQLYAYAELRFPLPLPEQGRKDWAWRKRPVEQYLRRCWPCKTSWKGWSLWYDIYTPYNKGRQEDGQNWKGCSLAWPWKMFTVWLFPVLEKCWWCWCYQLSETLDIYSYRGNWRNGKNNGRCSA